MTITVQGPEKEIAALVVAIQEQHKAGRKQTQVINASLDDDCQPESTTELEIDEVARAKATDAARETIYYMRQLITDLSQMDVALVSFFSALGLFDHIKSNDSLNKNPRR